MTTFRLAAMKIKRLLFMGLCVVVAICACGVAAIAQVSLAVSGLSFGTPQTEHYRLSIESPDIRQPRRSGTVWPFSGDSMTAHFRIQASAAHFYDASPFDGFQLGFGGLFSPDSWVLWGKALSMRINLGVGGYSSRGVWIFGLSEAGSLNLDLGNGFSSELGFGMPLGFRLPPRNHEGPLLFEVGVRQDF